jgi:hypothetical protein
MASRMRVTSFMGSIQGVRSSGGTFFRRRLAGQSKVAKQIRPVGGMLREQITGVPDDASVVLGGVSALIFH